MEESDISQISKRSVHGVLALVSRQFFLNIISVIASFVVYTELTQSQVGIYTAVIAVQRIISFFTDFGFGAALVQKKEEITQEDINTSFTLQLGITLIVFVLVIVFRDFIANLLHMGNSAQLLLIVLVFSMFTSSFKVIPSILLERKIQFQKLVIPQIVEQFTFNILLITLVLKGFNLNSYSWAFFISSIVSIPFYFYVSPWKARIGISRESFAHMKYGVQFQAKNVLATIKDDLLTVIIARIVTKADLGYIGFGQKWAFVVYRYIVDSVTKVTFSTHARLQDNKEYLRKAIEKSLFFVSAIMFPSIIGLMIVAPLFIHYIPKWDGKWEPAIFSLEFFCLNALVSSLSGILVNVLDANGKVKTTLRLMVLWTTLTWVLVPLLLYFMGYNGVALASFLVTLTIGYTIYLVNSIVKFSFFGSIYKAAIATAIMAVVLIFLLQFVNNLISLCGVIGASGVIYLLAMYIIGGEEFKKDLIFLIRRRT